jgi:hypothetical protein
MNRAKLKPNIYGVVAAITAVSLNPTPSQAQSSDALIDKLVDKGILSVKEANELREESDKNFNQAFATKTGMPDWVNSLKIYGDMRARYESFFSDSDVFVPGAAGSPGTYQEFPTRNRFRYRLRVGMTATLMDNLEVGLRLTSSEQVGSFGGDPISGNTTMKDNASKKYVFFDLAYGRWYFPNSPTISGNLTLGKMENPFVIDEMVIDSDYTPEGGAIQSAYRLGDKHTLKLNLGGFVLDENTSSYAKDGGGIPNPYMVGVQVRHDAAWTKKITSTLGGTWLGLENSPSLTTASVPDRNTGNTRTSAGVLVNKYSPYIVDGGVTYSLDKFPLYAGTFPIKVGGLYLYNPGAPSAADNYAWNAGITFGKSGKKGTWDLSYTYRWLGANAWYEELVDSDFGALYQRNTPNPGPGGVAGYNAGTNIKGHVIKLAYSPYDSLTLSAKYFLTDLINPYPANSDSQMNRFQVDASLKF